MKLSGYTGFLIITIASAATCVFAQENLYPRQYIQHFSAGISAGQLTDNSWIGLEISSPMMSRYISLRVRGSIHWLEAYKAQLDRWGRFSMVSPTVVIYTRVDQRSRWYIDIGPMFIIPQYKISEKRLLTGLNAQAGMEVFLLKANNNGLTYYFSAGLHYAQAYADKLESSPRYSNGFVFSNGFRYYFNR